MINLETQHNCLRGFSYLSMFVKVLQNGREALLDSAFRGVEQGLDEPEKHRSYCSAVLRSRPFLTDHAPAPGS